MRFLVVDDLRSARKIIAKQLTEIGVVDIVQAEDGKAALEILRAGGIDVVLCDWHMPHMTGLELIHAVRAEEKLVSLPFILVTSVKERDDVIAAAKAGISDYIVKPFDVQMLRRKLTKVLGEGWVEKLGTGNDDKVA